MNPCGNQKCQLFQGTWYAGICKYDLLLYDRLLYGMLLYGICKYDLLCFPVAVAYLYTSCC